MGPSPSACRGDPRGSPADHLWERTPTLDGSLELRCGV